MVNITMNIEFHRSLDIIFTYSSLVVWQFFCSSIIWECILYDSRLRPTTAKEQIRNSICRWEYRSYSRSHTSSAAKVNLMWNHVDGERELRLAYYKVRNVANCELSLKFELDVVDSLRLAVGKQHMPYRPVSFF